MPKLSQESLNLLSNGLFFLMVCLGIKIINASDLALKVADNQVVVSSSADRLKKLADDLAVQAEALEQKDDAYQELNNIYQQSLKDAKGYERLKSKIEAIENYPEIDNQNIEAIHSEIDLTQQNLEEVE